MIQTIEETFLSLDIDFPEKIWLLELGSKHMCYLHDGVNGLSCFENKESAEFYQKEKKNDFPGLKISQYTFDEARDIAKSKPQIQCLFLQDDINNIRIHYVR